MYVDKPMHGHGLMQAIARVNRVFKDKPGGLVVDYLGLAEPLKRALKTYTDSGGAGVPSVDMDQAIQALEEKYDVARSMMHGFDWSAWERGSGTTKLRLIPAAMEHVLEQEDGKKRFVAVVRDISRAFTLCTACDEATAIRDQVNFYQDLQAELNKKNSSNRNTPAQIDAAKGSPLQYYAAKGVASRRIFDFLKTDIYDEARWPEYYDWLTERIITMQFA